MDSSGTGRRAVTAFFDERSQAQAAIDDLLAAGVDRGRIALVEGGPGKKEDPVEPSAAKGFLAAMRELFMADEDDHACGEGLSRDGSYGIRRTPSGCGFRLRGRRRAGLRYETPA